MSVDRPGGIYNQNYAQEFIMVRTGTQWVFLLLALVILFTLPLYVPGSVLNTVNFIGITLIAVLGLQILFGLTGQISVGQSAFVAVGAYVIAILIRELQFSFWAALPVAIIVTAIIGLIAGLPSLRVKGFYLAMATLAAQVIIPWILANTWTKITGGTTGISIKAISIFGMLLDSEAKLFFLIWLIALFGLYFAVNLRRSRTGRAFIAIRDNELAAEVMGISLYRYKLLAFMICSIYAGVAGALWAAWSRHIAPEQFTLHQSVLWLGMLVVGGMGSNAGAIMGVIFLTLVDDFGKAIAGPLGQLLGMPPGVMAPALGPVLFGSVIIIFLLFEPRGLAHMWAVFKSFYRHNPFSY